MPDPLDPLNLLDGGLELLAHIHSDDVQALGGERFGRGQADP